MLTAGMYTSIINGNAPAAIGFSLMNEVFKDKNGNTHENNHTPRNEIPRHLHHKRHKRTYNLPEDSKRCISITKKGERCACQRVQESDYCVTHNKLNKPPPIQEEKIVKEPIRRTWRNFYGLLN